MKTNNFRNQLSVRRRPWSQRWGVMGAVGLTVLLCVSGISEEREPSSKRREATKILKRIDSDPVFRHEESRWDVFLLDVEAGTERRLTNSSIEEGSPALSEDARFLAFTATGTLMVQDLETNEYLYSAKDTFYSYTKWIPGQNKISVQKRHVLAPSGSDDTSVSSELAVLNPNGSDLQSLTNPEMYSVRWHAWNASGTEVAMVGTTISDGVANLSVVTYGGGGTERVLCYFDEELFPQKVVWLPSQDQIGVFAHVSGKGNFMYHVDLRSGKKELRYRAFFASSQFDIAPQTGRMALSLDASHFQRQEGDLLTFPEAMGVSGDDIQWYQGGKYLLYKAHRLPENYMSNLKKGIPPPDKRLYLLREGGGVLILQDLDDKYSLYVREEVVQKNGESTKVLKNLTLDEAQRYANRFNKGLKLSLDGFKYETEN